MAEIVCLPFLVKLPAKLNSKPDVIPVEFCQYSYFFRSRYFKATFSMLKAFPHRFNNPCSKMQPPVSPARGARTGADNKALNPLIFESQ